MNRKLSCIMLVDDNPDDNFFHEREIKKDHLAATVVVKNSGTEALEYLKSKKDIERLPPDLIFLDINMPGMNGWEFLVEYSLLDNKFQSDVLIIMLTTSDNPDDEARTRTWSNVSDYITKPLTKEKMKVIVDKYFKLPDH
jgi:CheY-like chemotaxis protein